MTSPWHTVSECQFGCQPVIFSRKSQLNTKPSGDLRMDVRFWSPTAYLELPVDMWTCTSSSRSVNLFALHFWLPDWCIQNVARPQVQGATDFQMGRSVCYDVPCVEVFYVDSCQNVRITSVKWTYQILILKGRVQISGIGNVFEKISCCWSFKNSRTPGKSITLLQIHNVFPQSKFAPCEREVILHIDDLAITDSTQGGPGSAVEILAVPRRGSINPYGAF